MKQTEMIELLDRAHQVRVVVLGDVMLDRFVYGSVARISPEAPIPVLAVSRTMDTAGGAANVARNIAAIGAQAVVIGVTGSDETAADLQRVLGQTPGVLAHFIADDTRPTTLKTRYVADGQQMLRADREHAEPVSQDIARRLLAQLEKLLPEADILVLSDYAKGVLTDEITRAAIQAARSAGKTIVVDPKAKDLRKYTGATILTPNRSELQAACGLACASDTDVERAAQPYIDQNLVTAMVVTRGKDGMSVLSKGVPTMHLRTVARQVFDVSGAGDTAVAAMSVGLAAGAGIQDASSLANLAAGIVVGKLGTAVVTGTELIEQLSTPSARSGDSKLYTLPSAVKLMQIWREQCATVAFTNGCFDLVHPGHVSLLEQARGTADKLIVGLNSDDSIRRLKGPTRPVQNEIARATVLSSLKYVDAVVIFSEDTPLEMIRALKPDVLVKGADYTLDTVVGADEVMARGGKVVLADLVAGQSTSNLVRRAGG